MKFLLFQELRPGKAVTQDCTRAAIVEELPRVLALDRGPEDSERADATTATACFRVARWVSMDAISQLLVLCAASPLPCRGVEGYFRKNRPLIDIYHDDLDLNPRGTQAYRQKRLRSQSQCQDRPDETTIALANWIVGNIGRMTAFLLLHSDKWR